MSSYLSIPFHLTHLSISQIPYPPPIVIKHHTWYHEDTNLFISIWGIVFGLHCLYFQQLQYFKNIMDKNKMGQPDVKGNSILYPIPFDDLPQIDFTWFLSFLYNPLQYCRTKSNWNKLTRTCINWGLTEHFVIATRQLINIRYCSLPLLHRQF